MLQSFSAIFMVIFLLVSGYFFGKYLADTVKSKLIYSISYWVLLLLFFMGIEFGEVFSDETLGKRIIQQGILYAGIITGITALFLFQTVKQVNKTTSSGGFLTAFKGCFKAMMAFLTGVGFYHFNFIEMKSLIIESSHILSIVIFLVGVDLVSFKLGKFNRKLMTLPILTLLATVVSAFIFSFISAYSFNESLLLASGFGWFSLSGTMINQLVSPEMGAMAFTTDFFREMLSIVFLYFLGRSQPLGAIGVSGAAALDSALPFIKENCDRQYVQYAIVSGFILTLLAPVFISLVAMG